MGMRYEKKDYPRFYGTLYAVGVNSVIWVDGEEKAEVDLEKIAKQADMSKIEPTKRPLLNPTLQLSGLYFMQELRRPLKRTSAKTCAKWKKSCWQIFGSLIFWLPWK